MRGAPRPRAQTSPAALARIGSRRGSARRQAGRSWRQRSVMTGTIWPLAEGTGGCMSGTLAAMSTSRLASICPCGPERLHWQMFRASNWEKQVSQINTCMSGVPAASSTSRCVGLACMCSMHELLVRSFFAEFQSY